MSANSKGDTAQQRFQFGENWARYLVLINDERVRSAEQSLKDMLGMDSLSGKRFLDIGSGSGLFSLAARNLGAFVHSFDYDQDSVRCTRVLKERYRPDDDEWTIEQGDVLDEKYLEGLGKFDVVYSWGVLHHTGDMWRALKNIISLLNREGSLFIALYNDQRWLSRYWMYIKRLYNTGLFGRAIVIATHAPYFLLRHFVKAILSRTRIQNRGMDPWRDILDWLGGYPFEVSRPEEVFDFYRQRGFVLERMTTVDSRHGCNEFVLRYPGDER